MTDSPVSPSPHPPSGNAPTVTSVVPNSGPASGGNTVTLTGTNFLGATAVRFGATPALSFTVVSSTQITAVVPPGTGTVQVTVTTPAGTSPQYVSYGYVTTPAPTLTSLNPNSGPASGGNTVTLTGTNFLGATAVRFGATPALSFTVVSSTQITAVVPPGTGTVQVTVTTPAGTSNARPYSYTAVPAVPVLTGISPSSGPVGGGNTVTLTGTNLTGATAVTFGGVPAVSFTVVSSTQITAVVPPGTAGAAEVRVTTPGGVSAPGVLYYYVAAPVLTGISPSSGPVGGGNTVTLTGTNLTGATAVTFGGVPAVSFTVVSSTQITAVVPPGTAGAAEVRVTTPGGVSAPGVLYYYVAAPVLTGISPSSGPVGGGNTVTLTGTNLTGATAVTFGGVPAVSFTVVSSTQITAVVPPGTAGAAEVRVTTPGGVSAPGVLYYYVAAPVLTGISPSSGPVGGGNTVTLTGTGLSGATAVTFGGVPAASFTVVSDTLATAVVPPGTPGAVQVSVTTAAGTSGGVPYLYVAAPVVTALVPDAGPAAGGTTVTLTGSGLGQTTSVLFGTTPAAFTVISDTAVTAVVPPGAPGPTAVSVVTPGGTSAPLTYVRVAPPEI
ncbi:beta strand repeat-containing protein [Streptomyces sp. NBC_01803]|uniref:beta strand repeat-containing protein n=1 Tax=Streptomyces sp. NBC_01803 TaxID=2975946 RepID=UPI002DDB65E5|nr:IPT/TIG domain-containing protein [Streptomyces sp. NBC_01803]WSA44522.1 IPT/TIG domain-containing protein [Streptomyces sp. NBC_01803]